ncbi:MAG: GNAT family N-acetyltransferase [Acidobacteriota bacterium]|nr:GNAT family N-acetyltransferase [Acidobacteriota bacterium]
MSASSVSLEAYAAAFTSAFQGYQFPVAVDAAWLARRARIEQHDLHQSFLVYEGDAIVAVSGMAIRGYAGWVCGFGVIPERRRRGLGREMMRALVERARACGLRRLSLEVLVRNAPARRLYEGAGMHVSRDLLMLDRAAPQPVPDNAAASKGAAPAGLKKAGAELKKAVPGLKEAATAELLGHFARLHAEPPAWQRDLPCLLAGRTRGLYLGARARPRAYALLSEWTDGTYLSDLAASDAASAEELCGALAGLAGTLKVLNESEHSLFVGPLLERGFVETERQHEMVMSL